MAAVWARFPRAAGRGARRVRSWLLDIAVRVALAASDASLRVFGFERMMRWVGARGGWVAAAPGSVTTTADISSMRLALVGVVMRRRSIWTRTEGPCLRQALLVCLLLRRYHPVIHLGLKGTADGPRAHAWVSVGQVRIDYDPSYASFAPAVTTTA